MKKCNISLVSKQIYFRETYGVYVAVLISVTLNILFMCTRKNIKFYTGLELIPEAADILEFPALSTTEPKN